MEKEEGGEALEEVEGQAAMMDSRRVTAFVSWVVVLLESRRLCVSIKMEARAKRASCAS